MSSKFYYPCYDNRYSRESSLISSLSDNHFGSDSRKFRRSWSTNASISLASSSFDISPRTQTNYHVKRNKFNRFPRSLSRYSNRNRIQYRNRSPIKDSRSKKRERSPSPCNSKHSNQSLLRSEKEFIRNPKYSELPLEWWERSDECKDAKSFHLKKIDRLCGDRESLVIQTTLWKEDIALEKNLFSYMTPPGILHYTLWSRSDLSHCQIVEFVDEWLGKNMPQVRRWQYDDNLGERSIELFHVHVFIELQPFTYTPRDGEEYFPPHAMKRIPKDLSIS